MLKILAIALLLSSSLNATDNSTRAKYYKLVCEVSAEALSESVTKLTCGGWYLYGEPIVRTGTTSISYCQAVMKYY